jgi:PAS domain S-box-containing protein
MIGVVADLTAQREIEDDVRRYARRDSYRVLLEDALRALADPGAIEGAAARVLGQALGAGRVFYGEVADNGQTLVIGNDHAPDQRSVAGRHRLSDYALLTSECLAGRRVVVADASDIEPLSAVERNALAALGARSLLCLPLVKHGRLVAVLAALFDRAHVWSEDELWLAETTAERTWAAVLQARAEQALAASQQRYRDFIQHSSEGIWRLDIEPPLETTAPLAQQIDNLYANGSFRECNDAMARMHGLAAADELIGRCLEATLPRADERSQAFVRALAGSGYRVAEAESVQRDAQGHERWFVHAIHGAADGGWLLRLWGTQRDITERKAHEAALREADRRKDQFLATLSHELRNPLAPVRTAARLLSMPGADAQQMQRAREVIERQTRHMSLLLDDLLEMARITQGKLVLKKERIALQPVVEAAIEAARPAIDNRQHHLEVMLPALPVWLDADPVRLAQVLANLLTNAATYTPPRGCIELEATASGSTLVITVCDNGAGIEADALDAIFSMFVQAPGLAGRAHGGLGVGLAIVKGLVDLHGGRVEASSAGLGKGSTFTVILPLAEQATQTPAEATSAAPATPQSRRRVLVADDNADAAEMLSSYLALSGHEVVAAADGLEALQRAETFHPQVALLDIGMPRLDGYALAQRLRSDPSLQGIQLVALTGWGQASDRQRALAAGFNAHFTKPVDLDALSRWIDSH